MDRDGFFRQLLDGSLGSTWSKEQIELGLRAKFHCEYCDRDLLASVDDYDSWQLDHLLPKALYPDKVDDPGNHVLSCKTCNFLKGRWDPSAGGSRGRDALVKIARTYVQERRARKLVEVAAIRSKVHELLAETT